MRDKYRIYILYTIVMLTGVFLFITFIFFIEKRDKHDIKEISTTTQIQTLPPLNKELEEPIKIIDDIEVLDTKEEPSKNIYKVATKILNIREEPNTESKIIKKYTNGDNIEIININDEWGELKSGGLAYMGFLKKNDNKDAKLASDDGITIYITRVNNLNIREEPNIESKIIGKMSINQRILIENIEGEWGKVFGGGFAYMELLRKE